MADKKDAKENVEETLVTLEQLSQTLDVMTCVVDRLKLHLERQISLTSELFEDEEQLRKAIAEEHHQQSQKLKDSSAIVEVNQREMDVVEDIDDMIVH